MEYFFPFWDREDYFLLFKWILGIYIVLGSLILRSRKESSGSYLRQDKILLISFVLFMVFFAGTRGLRIGTDTGNYYRFYFLNGIKINNVIEFFTYFNTDFLFEVIMFIVFPFKNFMLFNVTLAIIFNFGLFIFVRKFSDYGRNGSSLILFLMFACAFSFFQLEVNIIRNGLSLVFILLSIHYISKKEYRACMLMFIMAYLFHSTALIPIFAILIANYTQNQNIKYFVALYILGILLAAGGFGFNSIPLLREIQSDDFQRLVFLGTTKYEIGFRPDFVLYNSFFLFIFIKLSNLKSQIDLLLIRYYIITSVVFFLNFNIPFSDRVGLYSWIVIPLILFNTVRSSFPSKKLYISTLVAVSYFTINYLILFG